MTMDSRPSQFSGIQTMLGIQTLHFKTQCGFILRTWNWFEMPRSALNFYFSGFVFPIFIFIFFFYFFFFWLEILGSPQWVQESCCTHFLGLLKFCSQMSQFDWQWSPNVASFKNYNIGILFFLFHKSNSFQFLRSWTEVKYVSQWTWLRGIRGLLHPLSIHPSTTAGKTQKRRSCVKEKGSFFFRQTFLLVTILFEGSQAGNEVCKGSTLSKMTVGRIHLACGYDQSHPPLWL